MAAAVPLFPRHSAGAAPASSSDGFARFAGHWAEQLSSPRGSSSNGGAGSGSGGPTLLETQSARSLGSWDLVKSPTMLSASSISARGGARDVAAASVGTGMPATRPGGGSGGGSGGSGGAPQVSGASPGIWLGASSFLLERSPAAIAAVVAAPVQSQSGGRGGVGDRCHSSSCGEFAAAEVDEAEVEAGHSSFLNDWYPIDSMELDAVLTQEIGGYLGRSEPTSVGATTRGSPLLAIGEGAPAPPAVMSLRNFLDEDIPAFPFARSAPKALCAQARA